MVNNVSNRHDDRYQYLFTKLLLALGGTLGAIGITPQGRETLQGAFEDTCQSPLSSNNLITCL